MNGKLTISKQNLKVAQQQKLMVKPYVENATGTPQTKINQITKRKIARKEREIVLDNREKILFSLKKDEDGYPPFNYERIWAKPIEKNLWELDNIPFFATEVCNHDTILAEKDEDGDLAFKRVENRGGHSTIRVYFNDEKYINSTREKLKTLGCSSEGSNIKSLVAIDVPKDQDISRIRNFLEELHTQGIIDIDDGCIQHKNT